VKRYSIWDEPEWKAEDSKGSNTLTIVFRLSYGDNDGQDLATNAIKPKDSRDPQVYDVSSLGSEFE